MFPYKSVIQIEKSSETPVFIQIANAFGREIRNGILKAGTKLPGARSLADLIDVNRNTVSAAYDELNLQGYIQLVPKKGAFVSERIPDIRPRQINKTDRSIPFPSVSGYDLPRIILPIVAPRPRGFLEFDDGLPDERLAPLQDLTRSYRAMFKRRNRHQFGYQAPEGNPFLREAIAGFLNETRGLKTSADNIMVTRGSQMGIFLVAQLLIKPGDIVIVGETNYPAADAAFRYAGASLVRVAIDQLGIDVDAIERVCKKKRIRAVYVTPHHHFPTTVTLSACRRMNLLALAEKYKFAVIEDDYDYDFHYDSSPILPLASADSHGMVINIGSFSKAVSPALRTAYVAAPQNIIAGLAALRSVIDKQGDYLLEQALAELINEGILKRHLRKALQMYRERRDHLCMLLQKKLGDAVTFQTPAGGLAVWVTFDPKVSLTTIAEAALKKGLLLSNGEIYNTRERRLNSTRLGFASMDSRELEKAMEILKRLL